MLASAQSKKVIPFWPEKEFVQAYLEKNGISATPKEISLEHFLTAWIPGMKNDGAKIAVFPTGIQDGLILSPENLVNLQRKELAHYE